jgi:hypothetical protein
MFVFSTLIRFKFKYNLFNWLLLFPIYTQSLNKYEISNNKANVEDSPVDETIKTTENDEINFAAII